MTKVIIISTSASELKGKPTGLWIEEIAAPYYLFKDAGYEVVIASPTGGPIPIDGNSLAEPFFTAPGKKFMHDNVAIGALCHSIKLETSIIDDTVDAIFMPGGHGTCVDFINNPTLKTVIETMNDKNKIVSSVCHGPNCLVDCTLSDGKTPLVQGKTVTGFADSEEEAVAGVDNVPFLLESKLKELGGKYEKADDWNSKVCIDGNLITGQNPQSSEETAKAIIAALSA